jgi:hypothetical protein
MQEAPMPLHFHLGNDPIVPKRLNPRDRRAVTYHQWMILLVLSAIFFRNFAATAGDHRFFSASMSPPEASSSLLRLQRLYLRLPPHDTALYDALLVSPNATAREISQAYRRLCRKHHPDKQPRHSENAGQSSSSSSRAVESKSLSSSNSVAAVSSVDEFAAVQHAYEVLRNDATRLVYHQYGVVDSGQAVTILTGNLGAQPTSVGHRRSNNEVLRLLGYPTEAEAERGSSATAISISREERVARIASQLLEQLRVVVEGQVSVQTFLDSVIQSSEELKRQPLGAQILRCVGRAYRHSGQKALKAMGRTNGQEWLSPYSASLVAERVREGFRDAKHLATAFVASGRAIVAEHRLDRQKRRHRRSPALTYHYDSDLGELPPSAFASEGESLLVSERSLVHDNYDLRDLQMEQLIKTKASLLQSLQVEALWKVTKIEIDKVSREACELILRGDHFYVPSTTRMDGWVGSRSACAIEAAQGRRRVAELLVQMGNVMVEQSKEGTSWLA